MQAHAASQRLDRTDSTRFTVLIPARDRATYLLDTLRNWAYVDLSPLAIGRTVLRSIAYRLRALGKGEPFPPESEWNMTILPEDHGAPVPPADVMHSRPGPATDSSRGRNE